jgi:hypothetical protein
LFGKSFARIPPLTAKILLQNTENFPKNQPKTGVVRRHTLTGGTVTATAPLGALPSEPIGFLKGSVFLHVTP